MLNVTLVQLFDLVLLSAQERAAGVRITMPSAVGWNLPGLLPVSGSITIPRWDTVRTALTRGDFSPRLEQLGEEDVAIRQHLFLSAHSEMTPQLRECLEAPRPSPSPDPKADADPHQRRPFLAFRLQSASLTTIPRRMR
jgi:hypothetical protein